jgi:hypothetical protein
MSTTNLLTPLLPASSKAARKSSALVTSISSGAATTGTPLISSTGT